jgi:hypothetical protein
MLRSERESEERIMITFFGVATIPKLTQKLFPEESEENVGFGVC